MVSWLGRSHAHSSVLYVVPTTSGDTIAEVGTATGSVVRRIDDSEVPHAAIANYGFWPIAVYAIRLADGVTQVIDTATNAVSATIWLGTGGWGAAGS